VVAEQAGEQFRPVRRAGDHIGAGPARVKDDGAACDGKGRVAMSDERVGNVEVDRADQGRHVRIE
jgi:hypothetical protein